MTRTPGPAKVEPPVARGAASLVVVRGVGVVYRYVIQVNVRILSTRTSVNKPKYVSRPRPRPMPVLATVVRGAASKVLLRGLGVTPQGHVILTLLHLPE